MSFLKGITKKDENATPESIEARVMSDLPDFALTALKTQLQSGDIK